MTSGEVAKAKARWVDGSDGDDDAKLVLETDGEDETVEIRTSLNENTTKKKMTIIFLHGFGDTAPQWEAFARTLVRGMEDSMDVVLPSAPKRYYATAKKDEEETTSSGESDDFSDEEDNEREATERYSAVERGLRRDCYRAGRITRAY